MEAVPHTHGEKNMFARIDTMGRPIPTSVRPREPSNKWSGHKTKYLAISLILAVALIAFEIFNFDTTKYALTDLLGDVSFAGIKWAAILAIAFCGIDFAGLLRVFTPEVDGGTPKDVSYLMAAWLLGATMNAVMTWYAVSLTLLTHDIGNEVISREQLLRVVPIFVAVLVWLTRILFIGALSMANERLWLATAAIESEKRAEKKRVNAPARPHRPSTRMTANERLVLRPREEESAPAFVPHAAHENLEARMP